jgi:hypothetical protein
MGEKTTIEIDKIRELKQHALDTNKTLKQLINEAIDEKIQRERSQLGLNDAPEQVQTKRPVDSSVLEKTKGGISALEKILANAGLLTIVEKECNRHSLHLKDLSPATITQELMNDIHTAIKLVFDDETADQIILRIEAIFNNL